MSGAEKTDKFQNVVISNVLLLSAKWISKLHIKSVNVILKIWNNHAAKLSQVSISEF